MQNFNLRSGATRRKAASSQCRRHDALVSPAPAPRQQARETIITRTRKLDPFCDAQTEHANPSRQVIPPPTAVPVVSATVSSLPALYVSNAGSETAQTYFSTVQSHPIELSDLSGSESDADGPHPASAAAVAKQINHKTRQHSQRATAARINSRHNLSARPTGQISAAEPTPPPQPATSGAAAAATAAGLGRKGAAVRTASALVSMLVVLLAIGASSSTMRALLAQGGARIFPAAGTSSSRGASPLPYPTAAAVAVAASRTWQAAREALGSSYQAATRVPWQTATAAGGIPHSSSSSSSRGLIRASALPDNPQTLSRWQQISGVFSRAPTLLHKVVSMHSSSSGSGSGSSSSSYPTSTPTAATGDAAAAAAVTTAAPAAATGTADKAAAPAGAIQMYAVVDDTVVSPYKGATWGDVIQHMSKRLKWSDERFILNVITQQQLKNDMSVREGLTKALSSTTSSSSSPIFIGIAITDPDVTNYLNSVTSSLKTVLFWDSAEDLNRSSRVDGFAPATASPLAQLLAQRVGFSGEARAARVLKTIDSLWSRHTSDDLLFIWLVLLNEYVTPVPSVANTTKGTDLKSLYCMIKNCGQKIMDCVGDTTCKKGLDCLEGCAFNDQVCQYRCIVSYETPKFEQFALCILQLHNCRGLDAQMPMVPDPSPMTSWRGQPMTHEVAESLFIGWKDVGPQMPEGVDALKPYSWLVAAGKNPAYDFFPCQHQLYSYGKGKGQMWYEPVFKAITLDGHEVWRRRRYRVRRGTTPGTFHYSVLDNGVTSNEYWRIIDCAEDLTYCLFYYSGAAATAGLSYSGAVLGSVDGHWPEAYTNRIHDALRSAGIEPWELSMVDNSQCVGAPL